MPISANLYVGFRAHAGVRSDSKSAPWPRVRSRNCVDADTCRPLPFEVEQINGPRSFYARRTAAATFVTPVTVACRFDETSASCLARAAIRQIASSSTRSYRQTAPGLINANPRISTYRYAVVSCRGCRRKKLFAIGVLVVSAKANVGVLQTHKCAHKCVHLSS